MRGRDRGVFPPLLIRGAAACLGGLAAAVLAAGLPGPAGAHEARSIAAKEAVGGATAISSQRDVQGREVAHAVPDTADPRPRLRDLGIAIGRLPPGPMNAITDVPGVRVGHATIEEGRRFQTGVTAVLPHGGNPFREKVRAAVAVGNGFGKLIGSTQVNELGELETPILLTGTLSVWRAADALVDTLLAHPENRDVRSINPVVGETNDGFLSDIRARPIEDVHVRRALRSASTGPVEEGSVGAGRGTTALGWKGGIGTASRRVVAGPDTVTVGVLTQTNYGGDLRVAGVPVGRELGREGYERRPSPEQPAGEGATGGEDVGSHGTRGDGSVMIVVATDAALAHRELQRLALRAFLGIGRTGSYMSYGSGDYSIAFSTDHSSRRTRAPALLSRLFEATVEATEEAALNSLFRATTVRGHRGTARALPLEETLEILEAHGRETKPGAGSR